jgi:long-chain-fatty-acid--[acyl-carrier-protein] ligase
MPNHPGYIDPALVLAHVQLREPLRPLVYAGTFRNPVMLPMLRLIKALEVPDLAEQSLSSQQRALETIDAIVHGLEQGGNFLVYPSGRIQRRGREVIGAARAASEILARAPQANVVLVRTRGVWGSMFTFAQTGKLPNLGRCMVRTVVWIVANLLFFAPRRDVQMTVEIVRRGELPEADRDRLNRFLEQWYNREGPEEPVYVPYHFLFGRRDFGFPEFQGGGEIDLEKIRPKTRQAVNEMIEEHLGRALDPEETLPEATLDQLGLDSLERMELALSIEDRFGFRSDRVANTVGDLWALAEGLATGTAEEEVAAPPLWNKKQPPAEPVAVLGETLAEAFVRRALANLDDVAMADRIAGVLTYRRLLIGCKLLGKRFADLPGEAIGVLLPASAAAGMTFLGLHLADKLPVMMNWTTGPANLAHAVRTLEIRRVVTSRRFIDRLRIEVEGAEYVFLEDLRAGMPKRELLAALAGSYLAPGRLLRDLPHPDPDDPAVVLFTSGSESAPKAVPLSHRNLLTNCQAAIATLDVTRADVILGALPPFHSFGLLGNVIAPATAGFRVVYHPDPTDARGMIRLTAGYRATVMITTPTFLGYVFASAAPEDLQSLRIIVTGAEKCPDAMFARSSELAPQAAVIEGYGITECSPVVSANRMGRSKPGTVGQPVDGVEVCVIDPETEQPLATGQTGMLLVRGPSVFSGYLNYDGPDPFMTVGSDQWYKTGDLVALDEEGFIHFRGRLKRFLKAGGEMISLPALEEPLARRFPPTEDGPQVAVEGVEKPDGRQIVLFSTQEIPLREANQILAEAGFRGVMRLDEARRIDAIPVLGTGKTDYKVLRKLIAE